MTKRLPVLLMLPLLALSPAAWAADKTVDLSTLRTMVANLGYQDSGDKKSSIIIISGINNTDHAVTLRVAGDNSVVFVDIPFASIPKEKLAAPPLSKMLNYNDTSVDYFSFSTDNDGLFFPELQTLISAGELTPQLLRTTIDRLVAEADETKEMWDASTWSAQTAKAK